MSQTVFTSIDPQNTSGSQLATILGNFKDALMSGLIGNTRPTALQAGGAWIDNTNEASPNFQWQFKVYTGSNDITVFKLNLATGAASISGSDSTFNVTKVSADAVGPLFQFIKRRVANNGQLLSGDVIGELQFVGRTDASGDPLVARIRSIAVDQMTASTTGAALVFETTATAESAMTEVVRFMNRRMGLNTSTPQSTLHVKGNTGIRHERSSDDAAGATVALKKSRVTGTGQVKLGDIVGTVQFNSTDNVSNDVPVAAIENKAVEDHSTSALGNKMTFRTTKTGTIVSVDHVTMQDGVEVLTPLTLNAEIQNSNSVAGATSITALNAGKAMTILTGSTATTVRGIDSTAASKILIVHNASSVPVVFKSLDVAANAADRIKLPTDRDLTLAPDTSVSFFYNTASSQWKLRSGSGSGGSDIITTLGDLIVGGPGGYAARLPVGADGYRLVADSTATNGVTWKAGTLTTKGDLLTNDGTKDVRLAVGANDTMLTPDSTLAGGLKWKVQPNASLSSPTGTLPTTNGGTGATTAQSGFNNLSPLSAKGDVLGFDGTNNVRTPGGAFGQVLTYDSAQTTGFKWATPASGAGFNYLTNGGFEGGPFIKYATTTLNSLGQPNSTSATIGTTHPRLAITAETTAPLRGSTSERVTAATTWNAGDGFPVSDPFTLQPQDLAKVITIRCSYQFVTGSLPTTGTPGTQGLFFAVYDLTAAAWVPTPAGALGFQQSSGVGIVTATFQSSNTVGQQYQLFVFSGVSSTAPVTVLFDDFTFGTQANSYGPAARDFQNTGSIVWGATTTAPTSGTTTVNTIGYSRFTDMARVIGQYRQTTAGTAGSGDYLIPMPAGLSFDTNKTAFYTTVIGSGSELASYHLGTAHISNGTFNAYGVVIPYDATRFRIAIISSNGTNSGRGVFGSAQFDLSGANTAVSFDFQPYIAGWSSNSQISSDTDTRIINFSGSVPASTAMTANSTNLPLTTIKDSAGGWTGSTYVVAVTGDYDIAGTLVTSASANIFAYVNGSSRAVIATALGNSGRNVLAATLVNLRAGDIISFRTGSNVTISSDFVGQDLISISRKSGPSQIAATETVTCTVGAVATPAVSGSAPIKYDYKYDDSHNAYNPTTGFFTAPVSGKYRVTIVLNIDTGRNADLYKNVGGTITKHLRLIGIGANSTYGSSQAIRLNAGEGVAVYLDGSAAIANGTAPTLINTCTFERTGN